MKTKTILALALLMFISSNQAAEASTQAIQITDTSAIFLIDFAIDASYGAFEIPALTDSTVTALDRVDVLGYGITDQDSKQVETTEINALVLGQTSLTDTKYSMAAGTLATYTLMIVATFADPIDTNLTAAITKFPFWVDGTRTTLHQNQLDELETATLSQ